MDRYRFALAAATVLSLAGSALAQNGGGQPNVFSGISSEPRSARASNINPADSASAIAPALPIPTVGDDATTRAYLQDARQSLASGHTGRAQEAMERAETRLLDRSVEPSRISVPADNRTVELISRARQALGAGDRSGAMRLLDEAMVRAPGDAPHPPYSAVPAPRSERVPPPPIPGEAWGSRIWGQNGTADDWTSGRRVELVRPDVPVLGQRIPPINVWAWAPAHREG